MRSIDGAAVVVGACCLFAALFETVLRGGSTCDGRARERARRHDAHAHDDVLACNDLHEVWYRPFILT